MPCHGSALAWIFSLMKSSSGFEFNKPGWVKDLVLVAVAADSALGDAAVAAIGHGINKATMRHRKDRRRGAALGRVEQEEEQRMMGFLSGLQSEGEKEEGTANFSAFFENIFSGESFLGAPRERIGHDFFRLTLPRR